MFKASLGQFFVGGIQRPFDLFACPLVDAVIDIGGHRTVKAGCDLGQDLVAAIDDFGVFSTIRIQRSRVQMMVLKTLKKTKTVSRACSAVDKSRSFLNSWSGVRLSPGAPFFS